MPGQEQETASIVEREIPEPLRDDGQSAPVAGNDWEAYSPEVLTDLLDS